MAKKSRKVMEGWYRSWKESHTYQLGHCYDSWSPAKQKAYDWCWEKFKELNSMGFRIISHNSMQFVVGYIYPVSDGECVKYTFRVETKDNTYEIDVTDWE